MRFADFTRATRSHTLSQTTARTNTILDAARGLLAASAPTIEAQGLTLVGVALSNLEDERRIQLALSFDPRFDALDAALDTVRDRFGSAAVTRAVLLGRDAGVVMPVLPD
jgi:DNA polymerase-4